MTRDSGEGQSLRPRSYRATSVSGQKSLGLGGHRIELLLKPEGLHLKGENGNGRVIPIGEIAALRIGADYTFNPLAANDPQTVGTDSVARRHVMSIRVRGHRRPLRITAFWRDSAYRDFAGAMAGAVLAEGGKVERGVGYAAPLFFAAIAILSLGRGAMEMMAENGRQDILLAGVGVAVVAAGLAIWLSTAWWPRRISNVSALDAIWQVSGKAGSIGRQ